MLVNEMIVVSTEFPKTKWPRPRVGGTDWAKEFLEADELSPMHRYR